MLNALLANPDAASRVLALDHWMARIETVKRSLVGSVSDIVKIDGFCRNRADITLQENPSRLTLPPASGHSNASPPGRRNPDIGTHVLAMLRETVRYLGGSDDMTLQVVTAKTAGPRYCKRRPDHGGGRGASSGPHQRRAGEYLAEQIRGTRGRAKGLRLWLRDGRIISHDRRGAEDVLELIEGENIQRWHIPGHSTSTVLPGTFWAPTVF